MKPSTWVLILAVAATALGACGRKGAAALIGAGPDAAHAAEAYLQPPQILAIQTEAGGALVIQGRGAPDARIRGVTPDNKAYGATSAHDGRFSLEVPPSAQPLLIAISEADGRRALQTEGWLFVPPGAPARAVLLRAGAPSRPLAPGTGLIASTDFDPAGGAAISGVTAPGAAVDVSIDGGVAVHAQADAAGVFGARLGGDKPVTAGAHLIRVTAHGQTAQRTLQFATGSTTQIYSAAHEADGWRIAWTMPGGGVQTTFIVTGASRS